MLNCKPEQRKFSANSRRQGISLAELFQDLTMGSSTSPFHGGSRPHEAGRLIPFQSSHRTPQTIITSSSNSNAWDQKWSLDSTIIQC